MLLRDLLALYRVRERQAAGLPAASDLPNLTIRYRDYAVWEQETLTPQRLDAQLRFWRQYLAGFETLRLPADFQRPELLDYRGANHRFQIGSQVSSELRQLARELHVSLFSVLVERVLPHAALLLLPGRHRHRHARRQSEP